MSHRLAETQARRAEVLPDFDSIPPYDRSATRNERRVFNHFKLLPENRKVAIYSARRSENAQEIYAAIAASLSGTPESRRRPSPRTP